MQYHSKNFFLLLQNQQKTKIFSPFFLKNPCFFRVDICFCLPIIFCAKHNFPNIFTFSLLCISLFFDIIVENANNIGCVNCEIRNLECIDP